MISGQTGGNPLDPSCSQISVHIVRNKENGPQPPYVLAAKKAAGRLTIEKHGLPH